MGNNPSNFSGSAKNPVETINWYECIAFCNELTSKVMGENHCVYKINGNNVIADFTKKGFRLPTEAEWEYAAMGGKKHKYAGCNAENELKDYAWYDMSGNVGEWCWDWYSRSTPSGGNNPHGAASGFNRVWRGGSFAFNAFLCERAYRGLCAPDDRGCNLGLRLVCRP